MAKIWWVIGISINFPSSSIEKLVRSLILKMEEFSIKQQIKIISLLKQQKMILNQHYHSVWIWCTKMKKSIFFINYGNHCMTKQWPILLHYQKLNRSKVISSLDYKVKSKLSILKPRHAIILFQNKLQLLLGTQLMPPPVTTMLLKNKLMSLLLRVKLMDALKKLQIFLINWLHGQTNGLLAWKPPLI